MRLPDWLVTMGVVWLAMTGLYATIVLTVELFSAIEDEGATPPNPIVLFLVVVLLTPIASVAGLSMVLWAWWLRVHRFLLDRSAIYQYAYSFVLAGRLSSLHPAGCRAILDVFPIKSRRLESVLERCARGEGRQP